jgi:hypothetical protein
MTTVRVFRREGAVVAVIAEGHTGYAPSGQDIVCAGVSALMQCLQVGLEDVMGLRSVEVTCDAKDGMMSILWHDENHPCVGVLAESIVRSMYGIAAGYPEMVRIIEEDWHANFQSSAFRA